MIEEDNFEVLKLCSVLNRVFAQERELDRARWKVSYYRKMRTAVNSHKGGKGTEKWKGNLLGLNKKLDEARLYALRVNADTLALKHEMRGEIANALEVAHAHLVFLNGKTIGVKIANGSCLSIARIEEYANEYEANLALSRALANE